MANDNIFSGLRVVDFASFIAGPVRRRCCPTSAQTSLKSSRPDLAIRTGIPPRHRLTRARPRTTPGISTIVTSVDSRSISNRPGRRRSLSGSSNGPTCWSSTLPPPVRKRLKLTYEEVAPWNHRLIYADLSGYGDEGPDADLPGFDITAYWARSGLLALTRDAGAPPTLPPLGSGDHATAVGLFAAIVTALYRRERTGKGSHVTTSLVAEGAWSCSMYVQAALCGAKFFPLHDRKNPPNAILNVYQTADENWFVIVVQSKDWPAFAKAIGRPELISDVLFEDENAREANASQLTEILDHVFASKPLAHWRSILDEARITYGVVRHPSEAMTDPQLHANDIIVPLEGAGENLKHTVSSPLKVHGIAKVPARRAPDLGEHNDEVLKELGFTGNDIEGLRSSGTIPAIERTSVAAD